MRGIIVVVAALAAGVAEAHADPAKVTLFDHTLAVEMPAGWTGKVETHEFEGKAYEAVGQYVRDKDVAVVIEIGPGDPFEGPMDLPAALQRYGEDFKDKVQLAGKPVTTSAAGFPVLADTLTMEYQGKRFPGMVVFVDAAYFTLRAVVFGGKTTETALDELAVALSTITVDGKTGPWQYGERLAKGYYPVPSKLKGGTKIAGAYNCGAEFSWWVFSKDGYATNVLTDDMTLDITKEAGAAGLYAYRIKGKTLELRDSYGKVTKEKYKKLGKDRFKLGADTCTKVATRFDGIVLEGTWQITYPDGGISRYVFTGDKVKHGRGTAAQLDDPEQWFSYPYQGTWSVSGRQITFVWPKGTVGGDTETKDLWAIGGGKKKPPTMVSIGHEQFVPAASP